MHSTAQKSASAKPTESQPEFVAHSGQRSAMIDTDRLRLVGESLSALCRLSSEAAQGNRGSGTTLDLNDLAGLLGLLTRELFDAGEGAI